MPSTGPDSLACKLAFKSQLDLESHPHLRRFTPKYRAKKKLVKHIWIASACLMLWHPVIYFLISLMLATTFLSFIILDETA